MGKYRSFVAFALEERREWSQQLVRSNEERQRLVIDREGERTHAELFEELEALIVRTHYTIECFFVFGKILLDRVAIAIEATFGNAPRFKPSHGALCREKEGLASFAGFHEITPPPSQLIDLAQGLEETLTRFRDHHIAHPLNVRHTHATKFSGTGEVDVVVGIHLATESELSPDSLASPGVADMAERLAAYLIAVTEWVGQCLEAKAVASAS